MIYEIHGSYEVMELEEFGECGVWEYPGAMDEVSPIIVLPTVEAARIWVNKKQAPVASASDAGESGVDYERLYNSFIKSARIASQTQERTIASLQAHLAAETARAAALARALEPFAGDYHNWLTDNREETYLEYLNRMCDSDNVAISAALAYKLLHGNEAQQDASDGGNEGG